MILVATEDTLPVHVQRVKKEVLLCLQAIHLLHEYDGLTALTSFLDSNLAQGGLAGLTRVMLFYKDPAVRLAVEDRMLPGWMTSEAAMAVTTEGDENRPTVLDTFLQPECWLRFEGQLPDLRKHADRYEPGWVAAEMAKD